MTMEQAPFLPPLTPEQAEFGNRVVALKLVELGELGWKTMFPMVSGFDEQPDEARFAWFVTHEPIIEYMSMPQMIPSSSIDEETGMPAPPVQSPSLMQLNSVKCAEMLADYSKLQKRFIKKAMKDDEQLRPVP